MTRLFGKGTRVEESDTQLDIERIARGRYGAQHVGLVIEIGRAVFSCTYKRHGIRMIWPLPEGPGRDVTQERREIFRSMRGKILHDLDAIARNVLSIDVVWSSFVVRTGGMTLQELEIDQEGYPSREDVPRREPPRQERSPGPGHNRGAILLPPPEIQDE
jgi:hypothetical protein